LGTQNSQASASATFQFKGSASFEDAHTWRRVPAGCYDELKQRLLFVSGNRNIWPCQAKISAQVHNRDKQQQGLLFVPT
jgi:hypothetical protein